MNMMGTSGGSTNLEDAGTSAAGIAALKSLSSLLEMVLNPAAAQAALKNLTAKSEEIEKQLKQIAEQHESIKAVRDDITVKQQTHETTRIQLNEREAALNKLDKGLETRTANVAKREMALHAVAASVEAKSKELAAKEQQLASLEKETSIRLEKSRFAADASYKTRQAELETAYSKLLAEASAVRAEANNNQVKTKQTLAEAEKLKEFHAKRVASLKQAIQD
jgi:chromosome segregation ATPase